MALTKKLEKKNDPFNDFVFRGGCLIYYKKLYPHGSTGFLISNFAVRWLVKNLDSFRACKFNEDVCIGIILKRIDFNASDFCSNQFHSKFPQKPRIRQCSEYGVHLLPFHKEPPGLIRDGVTFHMHHIPMNQWTYLIQSHQEQYISFRIRKDRQMRPYFCDIKITIPPENKYSLIK